MSEQQLTVSSADETAQTASEPIPTRRRRRGPLGRLGCGLGLVIWALLIFTPTIAIAIAFRGEVSITTGPAPEQRFRVWLIMEPRQRGLGISNGTSYHGSDGLICVQTNTSFVLWDGAGEPSSYCDCYLHDAAANTWSLASTQTGDCKP